MNPRELDETWRLLEPSGARQELVARELGPGSGVWAARDHDGHFHLLIEVPASALFADLTTHGIRASVAEHRVAGRPAAKYLDLACLDGGTLETFGAVASDITNAVVSVDPHDRLQEVSAALSRWKWFWSVDPKGLSAVEAVGLFGELWFLARWAGASPASIAAWTGSEDARHDFQWPEFSVEVKSTSRVGPAIHRVKDLEQLEDPESGSLYLFSLRLARDALAKNTLESLVSSIGAVLSRSPDLRDEFWRRLSRRGYTPADGRVREVAYRVLEEHLFRVADGFPRLTRGSFPGGLPPGIAEVSYQLQVSACSSWLEGTTPESWPPHTPGGD